MNSVPLELIIPYQFVRFMKLEGRYKDEGLTDPYHALRPQFLSNLNDSLVRDFGRFMDSQCSNVRPNDPHPSTA